MGSLGNEVGKSTSVSLKNDPSSTGSFTDLQRKRDIRTTGLTKTYYWHNHCISVVIKGEEGGGVLI